jgi:hypothetical protein
MGRAGAFLFWAYAEERVRGKGGKSLYLPEAPLEGPALDWAEGLQVFWIFDFT